MPNNTDLLTKQGASITATNRKDTSDQTFFSDRRNHGRRSPAGSRTRHTSPRLGGCPRLGRLRCCFAFSDNCSSSRNCDRSRCLLWIQQSSGYEFPYEVLDDVSIDVYVSANGNEPEIRLSWPVSN